MLNIKQLPNGGKREYPYYKLTKDGCQWIQMQSKNMLAMVI